MKVREDFVTNSSSSSYIIAMHKDFSEKELDELIESNNSIIEKYAGHFNFTEQEAKEVIKDNLGYSPDLTIDDWNFYAGVAGDEYGDFFRLFLYYINVDDTEHFRIRFAD